MIKRGRELIAYERQLLDHLEASRDADAHQG
jgi:flagellar protein FlbT